MGNITGPLIVEGRITRAASNSLKLDFRDGADLPLASATQGGSKLGILFGFKNGGTGTHHLELADGSAYQVTSKDGAPTEITDAAGTPLATVTRGETSTLALADGTPLYVFAPDPEGVKTLELFRMLITDPAGAELGALRVIRNYQGWSLARTLLGDSLDPTTWLSREVGEPLKIPLLGTQLVVAQPAQPLHRALLLAVCVDIAIGLRPYVAGMS